MKRGFQAIRSQKGLLNKKIKVVYPAGSFSTKLTVQILNGHGKGNNIEHVAFSSDGTKFITNSNYSIKIWNTENGQLIRSFNISRPGMIHHTAVLSPDGTKVIAGLDKFVNQEIKIWNLEDGQLITTILTGHTNIIDSVAISPDGKKIVSMSRDNTMKIWNAETYQLIRTLASKSQPFPYFPLSAVFSPDGKKIVFNNYHSGEIEIWNAETYQWIKNLKLSNEYVKNIAFSSDSKKIIAGFTNTNQEIKIWNTESNQVTTTLKNVDDDSPYSSALDYNPVAFLPDSNKFIAGFNRKIQIWNTENNQLITTLTSPDRYPTRPDMVSSVAVSPDGKKIVAGCSSGTIKIFSYFKQD